MIRYVLSCFFLKVTDIDLYKVNEDDDEDDNDDDDDDDNDDGNGDGYADDEEGDGDYGDDNAIIVMGMARVITCTVTLNLW